MAFANEFQVKKDISQDMQHEGQNTKILLLETSKNNKIDFDFFLCISATKNL